MPTSHNVLSTAVTTVPPRMTVSNESMLLFLDLWETNKDVGSMITRLLLAEEM
jgi:hypothetical protein